MVGKEIGWLAGKRRYVRLTRFAREDWNPGAGEHEHVRYTLYTATICQGYDQER